MRGSDHSSERLILSSPPESGGRSGGRSWILLVVLLALTLIAGALAYYLLQQKPGPRLTLTPARYNDLIGWQDDAVAAAIPAFLKSCGALAPRAETAPLDARTKSGDFGGAADWRPLCAAAEQLPPGDDKAARQFFETSFVPWLAGNNGAAEGLFTGYFEISLNGSRRPGRPRRECISVREVRLHRQWNPRRYPLPRMRLTDRRECSPKASTFALGAGSAEIVHQLLADDSPTHVYSHKILPIGGAARRHAENKAFCPLAFSNVLRPLRRHRVYSRQRGLASP